MIAEALIEMGADIDVTNFKGESIRSHAENYHLDLRVMLPRPPGGLEEYLKTINIYEINLDFSQKDKIVPVPLKHYGYHEIENLKAASRSFLKIPKWADIGGNDNDLKDNKDIKIVVNVFKVLYFFLCAKYL